LPVVAAVEQDDHASGLEPTHALSGIIGLLRQAEPQHVHGRADILNAQAGALAHGRVPSVAADGEVGAHLERTIRRVGAHAGHAAALLDQVDRLRPHADVERGIAPAPLAEKIEEVPLRHQRDELAARRQMGEIGKGIFVTAEDGADIDLLLVRQLEKLVEQAKLGHDLQGRGVDGVAAEVAQEVGMLLEHDDIHARARQQEAEHQPAGPAADDAATRGNLFGSHSCVLRDQGCVGRFRAARRALSGQTPIMRSVTI
jgi:hypothetical protein